MLVSVEADAAAVDSSLPVVLDTPAPAAAAKETPLKDRLRRGCTRLGDGVQYGKHGTMGMYREGVKWGTLQVAAGAPAAAISKTLKDDCGVTVTEKTLRKRAKTAPGKSPVRPGPEQLLTHDQETNIRRKIEVWRSIPLPVTYPSWCSMVEEEIAYGSRLHEAWMATTDHRRFYQSFLNHMDGTTGNLEALDDSRALWETSANAFKQLDVLAEMALRNGMADANPAFRPDVPYSEPIIWREDGLARLGSIDETDVRTDQSKRQKSAAARSIILHEAGTSPGVGSKRKRDVHQHRPAEATVVDDAQRLSTKSARKMSWAGGSTGKGKSFGPFIISDQSLSIGELKAAPRGTVCVLDTCEQSPTCGQVIQQPAEYTISDSGGMEAPQWEACVQKTVIPALGVTPERRGILCADGLGQHHRYRAVMRAKASGLDVALRFPHGSRRNQKEDFENFSDFKPAHEQAKITKQKQKVSAVTDAAREAGREPTLSELRKAAVLTNEESMAAAIAPWEKAFREEKNMNGWAEEGIVPFTRKLAWDMLKEEQAKGIKVPPVPDSAELLSRMGLNPLLGPGSLNAHVVIDDRSPEQLDARFERLVLAEMERLKPLPRSEWQSCTMRITSADLFKLGGSASGPAAIAILETREVSNEAIKRLTAEAKETRDESARSKEIEYFHLASGLLSELQRQHLNVSVIELATVSVLKALVTLLPDGKKDMPAQPKKSEWVERAKALLGGEGAPKLASVLQQLASKAPVVMAEPITEQPVAAPATDCDASVTPQSRLGLCRMSDAMYVCLYGYITMVWGESEV